MVNFILEIYSEEIPASVLPYGSECLEKMLCEMLSQHNIKFENVTSHFSPRRLGLFITDIDDILPEKKIDVKGPRIDAPENAINGFLKSNNITREDLEIRIIEKKEIYFYSYIKKASSIISILQQKIPEILANFPWKKSMRWGTEIIKWIRPIQNIMCMLDGKIIDFKFGSFQTNDISYGHFFMNHEPFKIVSREQYCQELEQRNVIWDQQVRKASIVEKSNILASQHNLTVIQNQKLLDEVTNLVEYPNPLLAKINAKYMKLPEEVIITSMKIHQKYFCLRDSKGALSNYFIFVANILPEDNNVIIAGNERVINARLEDALFFWNKDLANTYAENLKKLKMLTFHQKLGSVHDKILRMKEIARYLSTNFENIDEAILERSILLCKTDLVTEMVNEFPELQGKIGSYYAIANGENIIVANVIKNHYLPQSTSDQTPTENHTIITSLADKIDSLVGLWIAGEKPTGSKDPFALRRTAIAIIRILIESKIDINLETLFEYTIKLFDGIECNSDVKKALYDFVKNRFSVYMKTHARHDVINSVLNDITNIYQDFKKINAIQNILLEDKISGLQQYIRVINIINAEQKNNINSTIKLNIDLLEQESEKKLYDNIVEISDEILSLIDSNLYYEALILFNEISDSIDSFFANIIVNDENQTIKINRLNLLLLVKNMLIKIADFSLLELRIQNEA